MLKEKKYGCCGFGTFYIKDKVCQYEIYYGILNSPALCWYRLFVADKELNGLITRLPVLITYGAVILETSQSALPYSDAFPYICVGYGLHRLWSSPILLFIISIFVTIILHLYSWPNYGVYEDDGFSLVYSYGEMFTCRSMP